TGADGRFCFAVPWYDSIVVGTTDTPYDGDLDQVMVEKEEVQYILAAVNQQFPGARVTEADITGKYAGFRLLMRDLGASGPTTKVSRKHRMERTADGLVTIAGGKLTTYRPMARETVDLVARLLSAAGKRPGRSLTEKLMLGGWKDSDDRSSF